LPGEFRPHYYVADSVDGADPPDPAVPG
jgi:hypothetical protein